MPTQRPRHVVTESDELAEALDRAAERWPELSRGQLVARLALEADHAVEAQRRRRAAQRRRILDEYSGRFTRCYGPGYLEGLRREWPA